MRLDWLSPLNLGIEAQVRRLEESAEAAKDRAIARFKAETGYIIFRSGMIAGAIVLGLIALIFVLIAISDALAPSIGAAGAPAIVGGAMALLACILLLVGLTRHRHAAVNPVELADPITPKAGSHPTIAANVLPAMLVIALAAIASSRRHGHRIAGDTIIEDAVILDRPPALAFSALALAAALGFMIGQKNQ